MGIKGRKERKSFTDGKKRREERKEGTSSSPPKTHSVTSDADQPKPYHPP